ncbi:Suppressor of Sensor Kinase (SLN1) [Gaertneriomyces sp. JEL0708]|nr:Suppressor of Sensor Kinase (SLN1) [Gaertneriomyces sp. JEL0708]
MSSENTLSFYGTANESLIAPSEASATGTDDSRREHIPQESAQLPSSVISNGVEKWSDDDDDDTSNNQNDRVNGTESNATGPASTQSPPQSSLAPHLPDSPLGHAPADFFRGAKFCLKFIREENDIRQSLITSIQAHGGQVDLLGNLDEPITHLVLELTSELASALAELPEKDLPDRDLAELADFVQEAAVRGIPVVSDTYVWQCIMDRALLNHSDYEAVRLDRDGQLIAKGRPRILRSASEPPSANEPIQRSHKSHMRADVHTAERPSIKRYNTDFPARSSPKRISLQPSSDEEDPIRVPARRSSTVRRSTSKADLASLGVSVETPRSSFSRTSSQQSAPGVPSDKVCIHSTPRPAKIKYITGTTKKSVSATDISLDGVPRSPASLVRNASIGKRVELLPKPIADAMVNREAANNSGLFDVRNDSLGPKRESNVEELDPRARSVVRRRDQVLVTDREGSNLVRPGTPPRPVIPPLGLNNRNNGPDVPLLADPIIPEAAMDDERAQWQTMLASVLAGEVIRSEKSRINGTVTQKQQLDQMYQTWLGIRAYLRGRSVPEERQRVDERRVDAEATIDEVLKFEVQSTATKSEYEQVMEILAKVDKLESLYPTRKLLILDKPVYAGVPFQHKVEALNSWMTISNSLRLQLQVLKNWTGSEDLLISRSQHPLDPSKRIDTSFIERLLKESGVKRTFEIRIMSVLRGLLARCKASMIDNAAAFKKMQLPTYINELQQLASFPSNLMEEILKVRLEYTEKLAKHSGVMLDQIIEDFGISLNLAIRVKHECQELDTQAEGWSIRNSLSPSYDMILLKSLKCYYMLLNRRLKSTTDTVFFKEAEMLENEWNFMSAICSYIDGGDLETATQFLELQKQLLSKVLTYLENGLKGVGEAGTADNDGKPLTAGAIVRWYARMLDNVRSRAKKLLKFQTSLMREFENASEYTLSFALPMLFRTLSQSGHSLVRTDAYANQGLFIFASPSLQNKPDTVARLLKSCFLKVESTGVVDGYILLLSPKERLRGTNWQGRSMQVRLGKGGRPIIIKPDRLRLVAWNMEGLTSSRGIFEAIVNGGVHCVKPSRPHVEDVHRGMKEVKRTLFRLSEGIVDSVGKVREVLSRVAITGGVSPGIPSTANSSASLSPTGSVVSAASAPANNVEAVISAADLIADMFSFSGDFAWGAMEYVGNNKKRTTTMMKRLVWFAKEWVDFCGADNLGGPTVNGGLATSGTPKSITLSTSSNPPNTAVGLGMQQKAIKWSLRALEFAMTTTSGGRVYYLGEPEFAELKLGVARCMRVLIRGFEQGGYEAGGATLEEAVGTVLSGGSKRAGAMLEPPKEAAPKASVKKEIQCLRSNSDSEGDDVEPDAKSPVSKDKAETIEDIAKSTSSLASIEAPSRDMKRDSTSSDESPAEAKTAPRPTEPNPVGRNAYHGDSFMQRKQKAWLAGITKLEEERHARQQAARMVGKVLDSGNVVERNISFLASTSSSISLRWQQGKFLGGGSFGSVYLGINLETADLMAVKEIRFSDVSSLESLQRSIKDEMTVLKLLHHPNIVEYYGVEVHRDKLYIFMEYCPHSISSLLEHGGRFADERVVRIYAKQMLRGLEYLHGRGIVHRDVKPANTLLGQEGQIKFVDFGASKIYKTQKTIVGANGEANTLVGTPHYIAPEVITGEGLGRHGAQDIWSLGCCMLEMVTGRKPWSGLDNEWAVMYHIGMTDRHPPLPEPHEASADCSDFLHKCFTRPATQRPNAKELLEHPWLKDVDENDLQTCMAALDPWKEAAENARARAALAQGHGSGMGPASNSGDGHGSHEPVFFPVKQPTHAAESWGNTRHQDGSGASDGTGAAVDGYFPAVPLVNRVEPSGSSETSSDYVEGSLSGSATVANTPMDGNPPGAYTDKSISVKVTTAPSVRPKPDISVRRSDETLDIASAPSSINSSPSPSPRGENPPSPIVPRRPRSPLFRQKTPPAFTRATPEPFDESPVVRAVRSGINPGDYPSPGLPSPNESEEPRWKKALLKAVANEEAESDASSSF